MEKQKTTCNKCGQRIGYRCFFCINAKASIEKWQEKVIAEHNEIESNNKKWDEVRG